jgi:hypothetical protein
LGWRNDILADDRANARRPSDRSRAQAQIERLIAEWFTKETGDAPADSQVRQHATKIMRALKKPENL